MSRSTVCSTEWRPSTLPFRAPPIVPVLRQNAKMKIDESYVNRTVAFGSGRDAAYYITERPEGYIMIGPVVAQSTQPVFSLSQTNFGATRVLKANGHLDTNYGVNGKTVTTFPGLGSGTDVPVHAVPTTDGMYVLGSSQFGDPFPGNLLASVAKLDYQGLLMSNFGSDTSGRFNGGGLFYQDLDFRGVNDEFFGGVIDSYGRLVATGFSNPNLDVGAGPPFNFAVARIMPNGTFDPSFGTNGRVITDLLDGSDDRPNGIILQGNKIIVGGRTKNLRMTVPPNTIPFSFALVRYNEDGSIDETFGLYTQQRYNNLSIDKGIVINNFGTLVNPSNSMIIRLVNRPLNKFLALGRHGNNIANAASSPTLVVQKFIAARYLETGALDTTFGTDGITTIGYNPGGSFNQWRLVEMHDGFVDPVTEYIYMVGRTQDGSISGQEAYNSPMVVRLTPDGVPDESFGTDRNNPGVWVLTSDETKYNNSFFRSGFVDEDGNLVVSGEAANSNTTSTDFFSMRFIPT